MQSPEQFVYIVESDLSNLKRKLKKGVKVPSRIVLNLTDDKYVLRIFGYNLVMKSKIKFERFDEVDLLVEQTSPKLKMSIVSKIKNIKDSPKLLYAKPQTDLII